MCLKEARYWTSYPPELSKDFEYDFQLKSLSKKYMQVKQTQYIWRRNQTVPFS